VIATAEAFLYQAASEQAKGIKRQQFLELAAEKYLVAIRFEPALLLVSCWRLVVLVMADPPHVVRSANPQSVEALRQMASTCVALVEETKDTDRRVELMKRAKKYYQWSLSIFPKDPQVSLLFLSASPSYRTRTCTRTCHRTRTRTRTTAHTTDAGLLRQTLYALGQLQRMMGNFQAGAELLLRALELDPNFHYCLRSYAELLYHTEAQLAELVYARARQCLLDRGSGGGTEDGDHD
jgi:tetratricopeptide (TPR) repeat protein